MMLRSKLESRLEEYVAGDADAVECAAIEALLARDPKARALFKDYLLHTRRRDQTLFFTTHLLNDVESFCDRLAILHQGNVRFIGSPVECCQHYNAENLEQAYLRAIGLKHRLNSAA